MSYLNNNKIFAQQVWWLTILFGSLLTFLVNTSYHLGFNKLPEIGVAFSFRYFSYLLFILGTIPTYYIFKWISKVLFKKSLTNLMLRIELIIWMLFIFTLNLMIINWIPFKLEELKTLFIIHFYYYLCLFCFILFFKIDREQEFIKTNTMVEVLDDDIDFKK